MIKAIGYIVIAVMAFMKRSQRMSGTRTHAVAMGSVETRKNLQPVLPVSAERSLEEWG